MTDSPSLYFHQSAWIRALGREFGRGRRSVMGQAPTGSGKTVCLAHMARAIKAKGKRVMICVHRQEIFLQTSEHLNNFSLQHAVIGSKEVCEMALLAAARRGEMLSASENVILASLPTLMRRGRLPKVDYLFVDEAHHAAAKTWAQVIQHYLNAGTRVLGVTATPERHDGKPLTDLFNTLVPGPSMKELIANGYLSPFELREQDAQVDRDGVGMVGGDYNAKQLAPRARKIVGDAIMEYQRYGNGDKWLVFCPNVEEAEYTAESFRRAGIRAASVDGRMPERERNQRIRDLGLHTIQTLMSVNVLGEGLDVPSVRGMSDLRPTYSRGLWLQNIGRTLRYEPGKVAWILDHAGNAAFHGNPIDITDFAFDGREEREKRARERERAGLVATNCRACFMPFDSRLDACPHCGTARQKRGGPKYEKVDGELVAKRADPPEIAAVKEVAGVFGEAGKVNGELADIAARHGLGEGWVEAMRSRISWWESPIGRAGDFSSIEVRA